jgi:flagellar motility protein MotE (MotC chaperone)
LKTTKRCLCAIIALLVLASCGSNNKQDTSKQSNQQKGQSNKPSVIDQEVKKQVDIYNEIQQHQKEQEQKVIQQTKERYKKLEKESNKKVKPAKSQKGQSQKGQNKKNQSKKDQSKKGQSKSNPKSQTF